MPLKHILILGAGPAGLSAALALSQLSDTPSSTSTDELQITVLELRPEPSTLGGSINLTPLAMRYLDRLGVGARLRPRGVAVRAIDMLSLRTGRLMGSLWPDVDALRARRIDLVSCMLEAIAERKNVSVRFGLRVTEIREEGDVDGEGRIVLALQSGEQIAGDVLLGCDGLHSAARKLHVEPERKEVYSGKAVAYGFVDTPAAEHADVRRADGEPAIRDTALVSGQHGALVLSFYQPSRDSLYLGGVMGMTDEHEGSKEGWRARGGDKSKVREDILARFKGDSIPGFSRLIQKCEDWCLFPVYRLPPNGRWSRGRAILLGDAAHAVSRGHAAKTRSHDITDICPSRCHLKARALELLLKTEFWWRMSYRGIRRETSLRYSLIMTF